jgi:hypothetical protein
MSRDLFQKLANADAAIERNRRETWTLRLAIIGTITGAVGALTGILALAVTIARG